MAALQSLINLSCYPFLSFLRIKMCKWDWDKERERKIHRVGEGLTKQNFPGAAASELLGCVSGLIQWCSSLLRKLVLTELEQGRKGITSVAFNDAVMFFSLRLRLRSSKTPKSHWELALVTKKISCLGFVSFLCLQLDWVASRHMPNQ